MRRNSPSAGSVHVNTLCYLRVFYCLLLRHTPPKSQRREVPHGPLPPP